MTEQQLEDWHILFEQGGAEAVRILVNKVTG
ncbi:MAG: hypothetical protein ACJAY0_000867 [Thalassolituus sp.]